MSCLQSLGSATGHTTIEGNHVRVHGTTDGTDYRTGMQIWTIWIPHDHGLLRGEGWQVNQKECVESGSRRT